MNFYVYLRRIQNAIFMKGDARSAFQAPDRAPTYGTLLTSPPKLRVFCSMWSFLYGRAFIILFCTYAVVGRYVVLLTLTLEHPTLLKAGSLELDLTMLANQMHSGTHESEEHDYDLSCLGR